MSPLPGHPELHRTRTLQGAVLLDLCRQCMAAGAHQVRFPLRGISMLPTLETGDVAIVEPLGDRPPVPGEIILFEGPEGRPVVHRVVYTAPHAGQLWVVTACDLSPSTLDEPVPLSKIVGRVVAAERKGQALCLEAPPTPAFTLLRARFRVAFAGRPRPAGTLRRAFTRILQMVSPWVEGVHVWAYRLRSGGHEDVPVTVEGDAEAGEAITLAAWREERCLARLELRPDAAGQEPGTWLLLGPRLWPNRPGPAGRAVLRRALEVARAAGATRVVALSRPGWHVRTYLLGEAGLRCCEDPELLVRLVQQAQEGDSRACRWVLFEADVGANAIVPRSPR